MLLTYDSILGIPIIKKDGENTSNNNNNTMTVGMPAIILLLVIIFIFIIVFSTLGKSNNGSNGFNSSSESTTLNGNGSSTALSIILGGVLIVVFLLYGLQIFFDINLTAQLNNLFTDTPSLDLTVEQPGPGPEPEPVPEIKIKKQVFHIPGNKYTYDDAQALCKAYGANLATYNQLEKAYKNGGEWCSYGWSDRQLALFPTQKDTWNYLQTVEGHENDCGRAGINGGYIANPNVRFGVNCYGYKPKITQEESEIMQTASLYPKNLEDIKEEKQVNYWKQKIPDILVAPFNKNVWSLI